MDKVLEEAKAKLQPLCDAKGFISGLPSAWRVCEKVLAKVGGGSIPKSIGSAVAEERYVDALVAAKQLVEASREEKGEEKLVHALVLVANVHIAVGRPREALVALTEARDSLSPKTTTSLAPVYSSYCLACTARSDHDEALKAAAMLIADGRQKQDAAAEALALKLLTEAYLARAAPRAAGKAAQKALEAFSKAKDKAGEEVARGLVELCASAYKLPVPAENEGQAVRMVLDPDGVAVLEVTELASTQSLQDSITMLQGASNRLKVIVLSILGVSCHEDGVSPLLKKGAFLMGLRSAGVPLVCCGSGRIQGYTWSLMMQMDYKIAAVDSTFVMPLHVPTSILKKLPSATQVAELCLKAGPMSALDMMGIGLIHVCHAGKERAMVAALEFASKLQEFPLPVKHLLGQGDYHDEYMSAKHPTSRSITAGWF